jgi:DNA-binding response OmpR family regulator
VKKKILIIDDEEKLCTLVSAFLEKKGYAAVSAKNGKQGLKAARYRAPDLILLDINMPKMDGFAVLEQLKAEPKTMSIPVIMLTGREDEDAKLKASSLYSEQYITKPFDLEELDTKISQLLQMVGGVTKSQDTSHK